MEYQTIYTIKESEKATVMLAAIDGHPGPVVIKKLRGVNPDIFRLLCHARNAHIPQIFDIEQQGEELILVEEYVDGENLEEYLKGNRLSDKEKLGLALQLCEAVEFLHSMEPPMLHRDIKPSNILITGKGVLKLIDFDASRQYKEQQNSKDTRLLGTVEYAPPEQFGYSQTDVRSDIYSMGVVFHEMCPAENKKLAEQWDKIAGKCTSFDPKNRYQSVQELKEKIKGLLSRKKSILQRICKIMGIAGFLGVILGTVILLSKQVWENVDEPASTLTPALELTLTPDPTLSPAPTPSPTLDPTPTSSSTLSPVPTPSPTLSLTPTPSLTLTLSPAPTPGSTLSPVPTPSPTLDPTPTPTPTLSPTPSPTPTPTPSPTLTPTPTPTPSPTLTPTPTPSPTPAMGLYPENGQISEETWYSYYKSYGADFVIPDEKNREFGELARVICYCIQTDRSFEIPADMLETGTGYVKVLEQFMMSLELSEYRFSFYYNGIYGGSNVYEKTVRVYPEEQAVIQTDAKLLKSEHVLYSGYPTAVTNVVRHGESSRITGAYISNHETGRVDLEPEQYTIALDGRVIALSGEYFIQSSGGDTRSVYVTFDDGQVCEMRIYILKYIPENPISFEGFTEMEGFSPYYQSLSEEVDMIFGHNMLELELIYAQCYDFITKQTLDIPSDMVETGTGYISVSGEYLGTLEPSVYKFIFAVDERNNERNYRVEVERRLQIYPEEVIPGPEESLNNYLYMAPWQLYWHELGAMASLRNDRTCRITGVSVKRTDGSEVAVGPEWYDIACDGRFILVKMEFVMQYLEDGQITWIYRFDDGGQEELVTTYVDK